MKPSYPQNYVGDKLDPAFQSWAKKASIGDRLRWLLEYRKMKQTELAEKIDQTQASVSNVITQSSRKPSPHLGRQKPQKERQKTFSDLTCCNTSQL
jgi:hypothetical protein